MKNKVTPMDEAVARCEERGGGGTQVTIVDDPGGREERHCRRKGGLYKSRWMPLPWQLSNRRGFGLCLA